MAQRSKRTIRDEVKDLRDQVVGIETRLDRIASRMDRLFAELRGDMSALLDVFQNGSKKNLS